MRVKDLYHLACLSLILALSGCVVRTYPLTRDRIDQDLGAGNRGYLLGQSSTAEQKERKATRTTQVVEVELYPPLKFERQPKPSRMQAEPEQKIEAEPVSGNRGYILQEPAAEASLEGPSFEKYTVQKGDTLQKISQRFYGTTKKWGKIYEANKALLKGPNRVYPGQVLNIPTEGLQEPKENLK